jgi:hypothetical protein
LKRLRNNRGLLAASDDGSARYSLMLTDKIAEAQLHVFLRQALGFKQAATALQIVKFADLATPAGATTATSEEHARSRHALLVQLLEFVSNGAS